MNFLKGRAILWLLIPVTIVAAFLWEKTTPVTPNFIEEKTNPDYFLINTKSVEFSADGIKQREFSSARTLHYLFKQETAMDNPILTFTNEQNEKWNLSATKAISRELSEELLLSDGVTVTIKNPTGESVKLTTQNLLIDLATENAITDDSILLKSPEYRLTAIGMSADLKENTIHFKSEVVSEEL